ncbi:2TM domain-containing protein [Hymenobacter psychrophilus]|uniref:2TM domain-containing protein n=1 Tax=Hymenobacter psychrophilus TaxID=651662 RepID=A0A1H3EE80_9BACT|nr:2TM domain-containing protein [Hymenobacter psychrophilus]SDX76224.1 2TM domain-containing protein [Hymenobacter psychrophilus]
METPNRDPQLWRLARQRAHFQSSLLTYLFVNVILWAVWAFTGRDSNPIPWPLWVSFFWGIGLVVRGLKAYGGLGWADRSEHEYEKLVRQQRNELR